MTDAGPTPPGNNQPASETMTFSRTFIHYLEPKRNITVKDTTYGHILNTGWSILPWQYTGYYWRDTDHVALCNLATKWRMKSINVELSQFTALTDVTSSVANTIDLTVQPSTMGWFFVYKDDKNLLCPDRVGDSNVRSDGPNGWGLRNIPQSRDDGMLREYRPDFYETIKTWYGQNVSAKIADNLLDPAEYNLLNTDQWSVHHAGGGPLSFSYVNPSSSWNVLETPIGTTPVAFSQNPRYLAGMPYNNNQSWWGNMHTNIVPGGFGAKDNHWIAPPPQVLDLDDKEQVPIFQPGGYYAQPMISDIRQLKSTYQDWTHFQDNVKLGQQQAINAGLCVGSSGGETLNQVFAKGRVTGGLAQIDAITGMASATGMPGILMKPMPVYTLDNKLHKMTFVIIAKYTMTCEFLRNEFRMYPRQVDKGSINNWMLGCNAANGLRGWHQEDFAFQ